MKVEITDGTVSLRRLTFKIFAEHCEDPKELEKPANLFALVRALAKDVPSAELIDEASLEDFRKIAEAVMENVKAIAQESEGK